MILNQLVIPWQVLQREEAVINQQKVYAIGVDYDKARDKFFARITPFGHDKQVKLHYWNTKKKLFKNINYLRNRRLGYWH